MHRIDILQSYREQSPRADNFSAFLTKAIIHFRRSASGQLKLAQLQLIAARTTVTIAYLADCVSKIKTTAIWYISPLDRCMLEPSLQLADVRVIKSALNCKTCALDQPCRRSILPHAR